MQFDELLYDDTYNSVITIWKPEFGSGEMQEVSTKLNFVPTDELFHPGLK